jgi:hypothetical protein
MCIKNIKFSKAMINFKWVKQRIQNERETIGYYDLPYQDTSDIKAYAKTIAQKQSLAYKHLNQA